MDITDKSKWTKIALWLVVSTMVYNLIEAGIAIWSGLVAGPALGVTAFFAGEQLLPAALLGWLPLLGLAALVHVLGHGLLAYSMRSVSANLAVLVGFVAPFVSVVGSSSMRPSPGCRASAGSSSSPGSRARGAMSGAATHGARASGQRLGPTRCGG